MLGPILFESDRLLVRLFRQEDTLTFLAYRQDKAIKRYQGWKDYSLEDALKFVEWASKCSIASGETQLAVVLKEINTMIGDIYLKFEDTHIALGYTCASSFQKKGYMSEILSVVLFQLQESYKLPMRAEIDVRNLDSIRLCERLGFKQIDEIDGYSVMERNGI
jgi:RimJ/RimL family protein N-acetyltransferase